MKLDKILPKFLSKSRSPTSRNLDAEDSRLGTANAVATPSASFSASRIGNDIGATSPVQHAGKLPSGDPQPAVVAGLGSLDLPELEHLVTATIIEMADAPTPSTVGPTPTSVENPKAKEILRTAWHGIEYLLKSIAGCLDGTPFKTPIAAINIVIELGNTIIDNKNALQELMTRTTDRILTVNSELSKDIDVAPKEMLERFVGKLVSELQKLDEMSKQATWKKVLDNQEIKNEIEGTLKQIDEHVKDFELQLMIRMDRNIRGLGDVLRRLELENWPRFPKARYDAYIEESTSLIREPCTPGTRTSILTDICQWATDPSPNAPSIFWLTGEAGSGKSTLAFTIAEHFDDDENILAGNFFCSRQFEETRQQKNIIPAIVYQLACKSRSYAQALLEANKFDSVDRPSKQMKDLLVGPWQQSISERLSNFPPYLVIVDALDEINGHGGSAFLKELLDTINGVSLRGLKFLVTSRPDPNIARLCASFTSKTVCRLYDVPRGTVQADITTYLSAKLPALKGHDQLTKLADKADGLFIYAATAVKYITPRSNMTKGEQLQLISKLFDDASPTFRSDATPSLVDNLYRQILWGAFSDLDNDLLRTRLNILHTILCTHERVSIAVAAALQSDSNDIDGMQDIADVVVKDLHAVLYIKDGCIFWYHASFPDFIFTQSRATFTVYTSPSSTISHVVDMSCDKASYHAHLTHSCFNIMMSPSGLCFNICQLPSSFLLDSQLSDLGLQIRKNIPNVLRYCSLYWAQHLAQATQDKLDILFACIRQFLTKHVLFWIEVMNLLQLSTLCTSMLQQARIKVLECYDGPSNLAQDLVDAASFATYFAASPAALSTPHLYISSLATWSQDSTLLKNWKRQFPLIPSFRQTKGKGGHTVPLMAIQTSSNVNCVAFSANNCYITSGSDDKCVQVWDASSGVEKKVLSGHTGPVRSIAFSSDGTCIVSGSDDVGNRCLNTLLIKSLV